MGLLKITTWKKHILRVDVDRAVNSILSWSLLIFIVVRFKIHKTHALYL